VIISPEWGRAIVVIVALLGGYILIGTKSADAGTMLPFIALVLGHYFGKLSASEKNGNGK
jgi:hypothetical protein